MGFNTLMIRLSAEMLSHLPMGPSVVELGNQTFKPREGDLDQVAAFLDRQGRTLDRSLFDDVRKRSGASLQASTADYYRSIGYSHYAAIDVNDRYGSLMMDLNTDLVETYGYQETFDLVTNNGTGEHIFNQLTVFRNIHNLCKVGGAILHALPFFNWLNHGFYHFNPLLFGDIAVANGYKILRLSIASNAGAEIGDGCQLPLAVVSVGRLQERDALRFRPRRVDLRRLLGRPRPLSAKARLRDALAHLLRKDNKITVVAALQKTSSDPFRVPMQGMYAGANIGEAGIAAAYRDVSAT